MSIKTISRNWVSLFLNLPFFFTSYFSLIFAKDWKSDLSLFESGINVNPKNVKLQNNYAMELKSAEQLEKSKKHYLVRQKSMIMYIAINNTLFWKLHYALEHQN